MAHSMLSRGHIEVESWTQLLGLMGMPVVVVVVLAVVAVTVVVLVVLVMVVEGILVLLNSSNFLLTISLSFDKYYHSQSHKDVCSVKC